MSTIIRTERYRRGIFGWIFRIAFIAFNLMMIAYLAVAYTILHGAAQGGDEHAKNMATGTGLGITFIALVFWALGSFVLGMLSYFTRGKKVIVETTKPV